MKQRRWSVIFFAATCLLATAFLVPAAWAQTSAVTGAITGTVIEVKIQTICIHGDSPGAEKIVAAVREGLVKAGATVKPLRDWFKG